MSEIYSVLLSNLYFLNANHAAESEMNGDENQTQREEFQAKYTHSSKTSSSDKNLFHCFLHCIVFS